MYNIAFSSIPIMWFALFDFEHEKEEFMKRPKLYEIGLKNLCFGTKIFWSWIIYGAL
jgi:magnesium-transporting ATPase (P-type)